VAHVCDTSLPGARPRCLLLDEGREPSPLLRYLTSGHVEGAVVILQRETQALFRQLRGLPLPVAYVGRPSADLAEGDVFVDSDNRSEEHTSALQSRETLV